MKKVQNSIFRLKKVAQLAKETNDFVHTTKLIPVIRLYNWNKSCFDFYIYLLKKSLNNFNNRKSLAHQQIVTDKEKKKLYLEVLSNVENLHQGEIKSSTKKILTELYECFQEISPGHKRLYVHTKRRKLEDPDLILMEYIVWCYLDNYHNGYWAHALTQFYCCDYKKLRFKMDARSEPRVMDIVHYFEKKYSIAN